MEDTCAITRITCIILYNKQTYKTRRQPKACFTESPEKKPNEKRTNQSNQVLGLETHGSPVLCTALTYVTHSLYSVTLSKCCRLAFCACITLSSSFFVFTVNAYKSSLRVHTLYKRCFFFFFFYFHLASPQ